MDHLLSFKDFVALEAESGGPSPNLKLIGAAGRQVDERADRAWLAGCYSTIYNTPGSLAIWNNWPLERALRYPEHFELWFEEQWAGLPVHSNRRRTHGGPKHMALGALAVAEFVFRDEYEKGDDYDRLWAQIQEVPKIGRYFGIKFAGALHELGLTEARQYDIRPRGAKNGRKSLGLIFPRYSHGGAGAVDGKSNRKHVLELADDLSREVKANLESQGLETTWFQLEALLCEYNQAVKGDRYPGKTSDADLDATYVVAAHWTEDAHAVRQTIAARRTILPETIHETRKRKDLLSVFADHGYMWSDLLYDYEKTTDLANPAIRSPILIDYAPETRPWRP